MSPYIGKDLQRVIQSTLPGRGESDVTSTRMVGEPGKFQSTLPARGTTWPGGHG